ncbi:basic leucine zipper transcription factor [Lithospermum erythrorhizon]|uniref:Basic leucine zipper transcription factor n=1 Tax=Lithospermum erythrorhizon TaxID=34254 RepID=A0AAV3RKL0_LITER
MWSSSGGEDQNNNNNGLSRGSSSSASSSSPSPFSPLPFNPRAKTMEEVWKDINLASLQHDHHNPSRGLTFQDFLARPFSNDPPNSTISARFNSPAPPPGTMLTLNSVPELNYFGGNFDPPRHNPLMQHQLVPQVCPLSQQSLPFNSFGAASGFQNANDKKRFPEFGNTVDRRNKRMIKNRESAARSRARKQESHFLAYTNELELEVARLTEENARLNKQQQQHFKCSASSRLHTRRG